MSFDANDVCNWHIVFKSLGPINRFPLLPLWRMAMFHLICFTTFVVSSFLFQYHSTVLVIRKMADQRREPTVYSGHWTAVCVWYSKHPDILSFYRSEDIIHDIEKDAPMSELWLSAALLSEYRVLLELGWHNAFQTFWLGFHTANQTHFITPSTYTY